ncbi:hypothetical protein [Streptomyces sp. NPDC054829]|nr:hypothetical protein SBE_004631 [Streptomyces sp. SBE_14.2]
MLQESAVTRSVEAHGLRKGKMGGLPIKPLARCGCVPDFDDITITTCAERPELTAGVYKIREGWPAFMMLDAVGNALYNRAGEDFPDYCVVATDGDRVVARGA